MASKTARRKFRPPLKEGASLPCSQASSASGLAGVSQERGKEGSQSWLSQLTVTEKSLSSKPAKFSTDNVAKPMPEEVPTLEAVCSNGGIFSLDDSLCSIGVEKENLNNSGDSVQDCSLGGHNAIVSPGEPLHQETQTHTVLSFCSETSTPAAVSELKKELSSAIGRFQIIECNQDEPIDDIIVDCSDSDDEAMEQGNLKEPVSRFQCKNKPMTRRYDFSKILPKFGPQRGKKGGKNSSNTKTRTKKRVTLDLVAVNQRGFSKSSASAAVSGAGHRDTTAKGDLSVYDYQPTPQQEGEEGGVEREEMTDMNNSNWISRRTREEQLAVDREVLKIIAKTKEEICILRENYAARKASRKNSLQFTASTKPYTFKVPQRGFRQSGRAKPSLVMTREDYGSSVMRKEAYRARVAEYTALEKREE